MVVGYVGCGVMGYEVESKRGGEGGKVVFGNGKVRIIEMIMRMGREGGEVECEEVGGER